MINEGVDCLVLGCTHYPYLIPKIREIIGHQIKIIDSGEAVARQTKVILEKFNLLKTDTSKGQHQFFINKDKTVLEHFISSSENTKVDETDF
jgi:glutamate racemase